MAKRMSPSWLVIVLRIYGALHIAAGGYCLLRTAALFKGTLSLVRLAGVLMILTGIVALLCKRWGMLSAIALALLVTCLLPFFSMPEEFDFIMPPRELEDGRWIGGMGETIELPYLRTNIPLPVLALIVVLEWLAVVVLAETRQKIGGDCLS
jgi:hypothetical protein